MMEITGGWCTLIEEDGLVSMTGEELMEWYQMHQTRGFHGFHVFDAVPFAQLRPFL